jgi:hypothetical protein
MRLRTISAFYARLCAIAVVLAPFAGSAQQAGFERAICPIPHSAEPIVFVRRHQIPTRPAHDDPAHKVITPGGMILQTPKMVAAADVLRVEARDQSVMCFELITVARDHHRCEIAGVAQFYSDGAYLFRERNVEVRFTFQSDGGVKIEPVGEGDRARCAPLGQIVAGVYTRQ